MFCLKSQKTYAYIFYPIAVMPIYVAWQSRENTINTENLLFKGLVITVIVNDGFIFINFRCRKSSNECFKCIYSDVNCIALYTIDLSFALSISDVMSTTLFENPDLVTRLSRSRSRFEPRPVRAWDLHRWIILHNHIQLCIQVTRWRWLTPTFTIHQTLSMGFLQFQNN